HKELALIDLAIAEGQLQVAVLDGDAVDLGDIDVIRGPVIHENGEAGGGGNRLHERAAPAGRVKIQVDVEDMCGFPCQVCHHGGEAETLPDLHDLPPGVRAGLLHAVGQASLVQANNFHPPFFQLEVFVNHEGGVLGGHDGVTLHHHLL